MWRSRAATAARRSCRSGPTSIATPRSLPALERLRLRRRSSPRRQLRAAGAAHSPTATCSGTRLPVGSSPAWNDEIFFKDRAPEYLAAFGKTARVSGLFAARSAHECKANSPLFGKIEAQSARHISLAPSPAMRFPLYHALLAIWLRRTAADARALTAHLAFMRHDRDRPGRSRDQQHRRAANREILDARSGEESVALETGASRSAHRRRHPGDTARSGDGELLNASAD